MNDVLQHQSVFLQHCHDYGGQQLGDCCEAVLGRLLEAFPVRDRVVLLKPNLISARGPALACTDVRFLVAAAEWFLEQGARVRIGDSPAFGSTVSVLSRLGARPRLDAMGVELVGFSRPVKRQLAGGYRVKVAAEALECDLFVNLPKLKAHNQMYLTAGVKNIFGIVVGMRKALLHMRRGGSHREFAEILLELPALLPPNVTFLDGIEVMHCSGPMHGSALVLRCVAGAWNPLALDTAILELLELPHKRSPLWRAAYEARLAGSRPEDIVYPLKRPESFAGSGFHAPVNLNSIRFHPLRFVVNSLRRFALAIRI